MMKKSLIFKLFALALVVGFSVSSCKDYNDDIQNLDKQISDLKSKLDEINESVNQGAVITDVKRVDGGIQIITTKGEYFISNGADGRDGADADVWTIGNDGYWYKNDVRTEYRAIGKDGVDGKDGKNGVDGKDGLPGAPGEKGEKGDKGDKGDPGADGKDGKDGVDGKDGKYYIPKDDGYWYVVEDGVETKTEDKWQTPGVITAVFKDGVLTLSGVEGAENGIVKLGLVQLNNLIVIPDYVADDGGALPVVNFASLKASCGDISLPQEVKFRVSPSNVSVDLIDTANLKFIYNNPKVRADVGAEATFKSLKDGILTVGIEIDTKKLETDGESIDQVMLEVPLMGQNASVFSDWIMLTAEPIEAKDLAIARLAGDKKYTEKHKLTKTLAATKALVAKGDDKDIRVIDLAYSETLDLNKELATLYGLSEFEMEKYGLYFEYDLKDEFGKTIVYELGDNKTDQQKFINLSGSEVSTRVYDVDGANPASIDRTPIVRVRLLANGLNCDLGLGFVKLNIIPVKVEPIEPITQEIIAGTVEAGCDDFVKRVGTQEMNEKFYAVAKVSKDNFHKLYKFEELTGGVGTIKEVVDPEDTQSYNLIWTLTPDELAANVGKNVTKSAQYKYGDNIIKVTFKATIKQPELNIKGYLLDNYWYNDFANVQHNVAVPALGSTDSSKCTFENNISAAFKTTDGKLLDLPEGYTYEYKFAIPQNLVTAPGYTITVSDDQKELKVTKGGVTETVATIKPSVDGTGDMLAYNEESDLAKELLNMGPEFMKARLQLSVKNSCEKDVKVSGFKYGDKFDVHFLRPINVEGDSKDYFVDAATFGDDHTLLDIKNVVALEDWRNLAKNTEIYSFEKNPNYYDYYGVEEIAIDLENITTDGLTIDGKTYDKLPSTVEIKVYKDVAELEADGVEDTSKYPENADYGVLGYKNNGNTLGTDFTLIVPIKVVYKWGEITSVKVRVPVKATANLRSLR